MNKINKFKALYMVFLIISISFIIPISIAPNAHAAEGDDVFSNEVISTPEEQCIEKAKDGESFVDFMDNGIIATLEKVAAILFALATIVNTIDFFINTIGSFIGLQGATPESTCCTSVFGEAGLCQQNFDLFSKWKKLTSTGILGGIVSIATCECCSGGDTVPDGLGGSGEFAKYGGGAGGLCPLGNVADAVGGSIISNNPYEGTGLAQLHLSAFDNIYMAAGCMCPVAILFNLRKLKSIYQVNNCCVEQACENGISTEVCEVQKDEALCMYWQGSILKSLITVLASVLTGYVAGMVASWFKDGIKATIASCAVLVLDLVSIPSKIQAVSASFNWMTTTFDEPQCSDIGFDDIDDQLIWGWDSEAFGIRELMLVDLDGDGVKESTAVAQTYSYDEESGTGKVTMVDGNTIDFTSDNVVLDSNENIIYDAEGFMSLTGTAEGADLSLWKINPNKKIAELNTGVKSLRYTDGKWNTMQDGKWSPATGDANALNLGAAFYDGVYWVREEDNNWHPAGYPSTDGISDEVMTTLLYVDTPPTQEPETPEDPDTPTEPETPEEPVDPPINDPIYNQDPWNHVYTYDEDTNSGSISLWTGEVFDYNENNVVSQGESNLDENGFVHLTGSLGTQDIDGWSFNPETGVAIYSIGGEETLRYEDGLWKKDLYNSMDPWSSESITDDKTYVAIEGVYWEKGDDNFWRQVGYDGTDGITTEQLKTIGEDTGAETLESVDETENEQDSIDEQDPVETEEENLAESELAEAKEKARKQVKASLTDEQAQKIAYDLTWQLLDLTMQEFIFPIIDDMCKEDFEASEPAEEEPQDTSSGDGGTGGVGTGTDGFSGDGGDGAPGGGIGEPCDDDIFHGELFEDVDGYHVSYTIRACTGLISFNVYLSGDEPDYLVDIGFAAEGQEISDTIIIDTLPPEAYHNVCIQAGLLDQCF